jgi:hypothetical protein
MKGKKKPTTGASASGGKPATVNPGVDQRRGNAAAQQALPQYRPGMDPDGGVRSKVTDDMRLQSLAEVPQSPTSAPSRDGAQTLLSAE